MSNIQLIIEERSALIGNFRVGRLLPFREKRTVGPFAFIDHMGPVAMNDHENMDVPPHPHIGLSTLTYLFEGSIMHKDSLGTEIEIKPGAVNWMTAGRGIVHSERTPAYLRQADKHLHGLQIWVALPKELEDMEPAFSHWEAASLPAWQQDGISFKLIAGEAFGRKSPVPVYSPLYLLEIKVERATPLSLGNYLYGESAVYILEGSVFCDGNAFKPKQFLVSAQASLCTFETGDDTTLYIFGGEPFPEERFIFWNFVSSDKHKIEKAKEDWLEQKFPVVPGETEYVPLPSTSIRN